MRVVQTLKAWTTEETSLRGSHSTVGPNTKKPAKNKFKKSCEIDWSSLCLQQFGKFWILMKIVHLPETEIAKVSFITNIEQLKWIYFWLLKPLCTASEANREITSTAVKVRSKGMLQNLIQRKAGWIWNFSKQIQVVFTHDQLQLNEYETVSFFFKFKPKFDCDSLLIYVGILCKSRRWTFLCFDLQNWILNIHILTPIWVFFFR